MQTITIRDTFLLDAVKAAAASALRVRLTRVPPELDAVQMRFGRANDESGQVCACTVQPDGTWTCYAAPGYFPAAGTFAYHVTGLSPEGHSVYLGRGELKVSASVLNVSSADTPLLPEDTYVRGANGLYYKLTAALDDDGVPYINVSEDGVTR